MEVRLSVAALQPASLTGRWLITRLLGAKLRGCKRLNERVSHIKCQHHGVFALKHWDYLWRAVYALAAAIQIQIQVTWAARRLFCSTEPGRLGQKASGPFYSRVRYYAGQAAVSPGQMIGVRSRKRSLVIDDKDLLNGRKAIEK